MKNYIDIHEIYLEGIKSLSKRNYAKARSNFEIASNDPKLREIALERLVKLDLKEGKYKQARKHLACKTENSSYTNFLYGQLENYEYNIEASQRYYKSNLLDENYQESALWAIGRNNMQLGNYRLAKKMLETSRIIPRTREQGLYELIYLDILENNYQEAQKLLDELFKYCKENSRPLGYTFHIRGLLKYHMGILEPADETIDPIHKYRTYRLYYNDDEAILNHIQKHKEESQRYQNGCFFKYLDLRELYTLF